jgi:hypothetical protein
MKSYPFLTSSLIIALFSCFFLSCSRYEGEVFECMTILDCEEGFSCVDNECVYDPSGNETQPDNTQNTLPDAYEEPDDNEIIDEIDEIQMSDETEEPDEQPEEITDQDTGGGGTWQEVICSKEAECDENSVCYKEGDESKCVDPYKKYWKVSIDSICLSDKKPNGENWDSGIAGVIDQPDPYAMMYINLMEALRTPYADEQKCAHWQNFTNLKFNKTEAVLLKIMEYDSMMFNDDDNVGTYEWGEGIPIEVFKEREFVFDDSSNPGYTYIRITFKEMD